MDRDEWEWEKEARSFQSKGKVLFPEANYTQFKEMYPSDLFDLFFDQDILVLRLAGGLTVKSQKIL